MPASFVEAEPQGGARGLRGASRSRPGAAPASGPPACATCDLDELEPRHYDPSTRATSSRDRRRDRRRGARGADRPARREHDLHRRSTTPTSRRDPHVAREGRRAARRARAASSTASGSARRGQVPGRPAPRSGPAARSCYVPKNLKIEKPIQVVYVIDEPGTAQYAHTLGVVGEFGECDAARVLPGARLRGPGAARRRLRALRAGPARRSGSRTSRTGARARCTTSPPSASRSRATPTAAGCRSTSAATSPSRRSTSSPPSRARTCATTASTSPRATSTSTSSRPTCTSRATPPATPSGRARSPASRARPTRA